MRETGTGGGGENTSPSKKTYTKNVDKRRQRFKGTNVTAVNRRENSFFFGYDSYVECVQNNENGTQKPTTRSAYTRSLTDRDANANEASSSTAYRSTRPSLNSSRLISPLPRLSIY